MPAIRQSFGNSYAANTCLRSPARIDLNQHSPGAFCLVREHLDKPGPSGIEHGLRQHSAGEALHVQILDGDHAVSVDQLAREFVMEVGALARYVAVDALKNLYGLAPTIAAPFTARHLPLSAPQPALRVPVVSRVLDFSPIGQHGETIQADIDPRRSKTGGQQRGLALYTEDHEPTASFALNGHCFYRAFEWPVQLHFDMAGALDAQLPGIEQPASIAVGRKGDAVVAPRRTVSREARLGSTLHPAEESLEGFIDATEHVLAAGEICERQATVRAHRLQLGSLVVVIDRLAAHPPCADPLLKGGVVEARGLAKLASEEDRLRGSRIETVFETETQLAALLPFDIFTDHGFAHRPDRTGIVATAPQRRQAGLEKRELLTQSVRAKSLQAVYDFGHADCRVAFDEQMHVVGHDLHAVNRQPQFGGLLSKQRLQPRIHRIDQYGAPVFGTPYDVVLQTENRTSIFGVSFAHASEYTPGNYLTQEKRQSAHAESLFRCRLKATVPEA